MSKKIYLFSTASYPDTIHINSLDTKFFHPQIDFSQYDYLIISSKQISLALTEYEKQDYLAKPALCVSSQSAKSFEDLGGKILQIGGGYGENLADILKQYPRDTQWLYLRAKEVASDFVEISKADGYHIDERIVYETSCSEAIKNTPVEDDAILIFTSPSGVQCFLTKHAIKPTHTIVTIGTTTAKALPEHTSYVIAEETTIASCVALAKKLV